MTKDGDTRDDGIRVDPNGLLEEIGALADATRHITASAHGLAAPLAALRLRQLRQESARASARFGRRSPQARSRAEHAASGEVRVEALRTEFERIRIDPPPVERDRERAGFYGRVVDGGSGREGLLVGAIDEQGAWRGYACTGARGEFAFTVPAGPGLRIVVDHEDGGRLHRDSESGALAPGQSVWREIDLSAAGPPCRGPGEEERPDDEPRPEPLTVIDVVGLEEVDAVTALRRHGFVRGRRSTRPDDERVGRVIEQDPEAGSEAEAGAAVAIVVGSAEQTVMPGLVGAPLEAARRTVAEIPHRSLEVEEVADPSSLGIVIDQAPREGEAVTEATDVVLTVGTRADVAMPSLIGAPLARARIALAEIGISRIELRERPDPERIGTVVAQRPRGGTSVDASTTVELTIGTARIERDPDSTVGFEAIVQLVERDDRYERLRLPREALRSAFRDHGVTTVSDLQRLADAEPKDLRETLGLRTLTVARDLGILLRAALAAADQE